MAVPEGTLAGARVLITRPAHQAEPLVRAILEAGGTPVRLPTIEITEPVDPLPFEKALTAIPHAGFAIFVSRNAVLRGFPALRDHGWPPTLRFAAVGAATARALHAEGIPDVLAPADRFDSEALLDLLPAEAVRGQTILLFHGEGGRERLAEGLAARGAHVVHAVCYRRQRPASPDPEPLAQLARGNIDIIVATSGEALENLTVMVGADGRERLLATPLLVVSERTRTASHALGFHGMVVVATRAEAQAMLDALCAWHAAQNNL